MKTIIRTALAAVMVFSATTIYAQRGQGGQGSAMTPEDRAKMRTERMAKELSLNEKQQKELYKYYLESDKQRAEMMKKSEEERKAHMQKNMAANDAKMKELLTPEQYEKWKEAHSVRMGQQQKGPRGEGKHNNGAGKRPNSGKGKGNGEANAPKSQEK